MVFAVDHLVDRVTFKWFSLVWRFVSQSKLRVIQSNDMGFPLSVDDECWSGLKSFTAREEKSKTTLKNAFYSEAQ